MEQRTEPVPIDLVPVHPGAWRACDARFAYNDAQSLVGFVEDVGDEVEVMVIGDRFSWAFFPTLTDAVEFLRAVAAELTVQRSRGPVAQLREAAAQAISS
ncbi:hypothetical protein G3T36_17925 [Diaminobutyricibacter tongyongensis]|uniref:Uncharacterized protein n=1 Tax=Leifsonia tongyongensis TaxID=1268043 RepID=A0A6L9Y394_9MICO|nr:hypothetical protein [Diaminobutyricibacter tongyongensis]NEN07738.1 hypothetical protein [Diaminobutyricibacter tongyongensis]